MSVRAPVWAFGRPLAHLEDIVALKLDLHSQRTARMLYCLARNKYSDL